MEYNNPEKVEHTDATATLGFEKATDNTIPIWPGDCPHCLQPFNKSYHRHKRNCFYLFAYIWFKWR